VAFHPGQCARLWIDGSAAGWVGALHPALLQKYEIADAAVGFEVDLGALQRRRLPSYQPIPRFQSVRRDIALLVDSGLPAQLVRDEIEQAGSPLVSGVTLFDVYAGDGVPAGRKSLAFRVLLQDTEKTLTEAEVEAQIQRILRVLQEKHRAILRA
jgi:phenylalanyl-tRNA synthetase beta chain